MEYLFLQTELNQVKVILQLKALHNYSSVKCTCFCHNTTWLSNENI